MPSQRLKNRLSKDRPITSITLRIPNDVVESMAAVAPLRGLTGDKTLPNLYIREGCGATRRGSPPTQRRA
jgi:hypothetical protein